MSERNEADATSSCASCGIAQEDDIKLRRCTACYLVKYCSIKCQRDHRPKHKRECKKRAAELRDELLFKQPESSCFGDCPICCLPLSLEPEKCTMMVCCSKILCNGCVYGCRIANFNNMQERRERIAPSCPFCRTLTPKTKEEQDKQMKKRLEANDPVALRSQASEQYNKRERDCSGAFEYWTKAAGLGDAVAHYKLSLMYHHGEGVEKDTRKEIHHAEEAAIGGHPGTRHHPGREEWNKGNTERAVRHWIIAATLGYDLSITSLIDAFKGGFVSKEELASTLRAHRVAVDATKSPQREAAEKNARNRM